MSEREEASVRACMKIIKSGIDNHNCSVIQATRIHTVEIHRCLRVCVCGWGDAV